MLAVTEGEDPRFDRDTYSIYSYNRLRELWREGNPFAWHLSLESRLLFSEDGTDFLRTLGTPCPYLRALADCEKFANLFCAARDSIHAGSNSPIFELSTIFLAIRNFATCFSLGLTDRPNFSRRAALHLGSDSLDIDPSTFNTLERARLLSTRGAGIAPIEDELHRVVLSFETIDNWMNGLRERARSYERV